MRRFVGYCLLFGCALFVNCLLSVQTLRALEATPPPTQLPNSPLLITGYFDQGGYADTGELLSSTVRYIEVYNNSDQVVALDGWTINVARTTDASSIALTVPVNNYLAPHAYAVISFDGFITNALFSTPGMPLATNEFVSTISLSHDGFVPYAAVVSDDKSSGKKINLTPMQLTPTTTGYTTTGKYRTDERSGPYQDALYAPRAEFALSPIEILANSRNCAPTEIDTSCGDYIKFYNNTTQTIDFTGVRLRIGYRGQTPSSANTIRLSGEIQPGQYAVFTKNEVGEPLSITNSGDFVWLEDTYGLIRYDNTMTSYPDASSTTHKGQSWAQTVDGSWAWSMPNPGGENKIIPPEIETLAQTNELVSCRTDQYRSSETNRCRNLQTTSSAGQLAPCRSDQYRSSETNRCRNISSSTVAGSLTPCKENQYRNLETNRCRSLASSISAQLKPCQVGWERNAETNRCRKADVLSASQTVGYPIEKIPASADAVASWWAIGGIGVVALGGGVWQYRYELGEGLRRAMRFATRRS